MSEQQLLETSIDRLPVGATLIGDANFGVFSVAWTTAQKGVSGIAMAKRAAARVSGWEALQGRMDRHIAWKPSRADRKAHPHLPANACVRGSLIVRQVKPDNGAAPFLLTLFTTLPDPVREIRKLHGQRWNIETDLRTLKSQLRMEQLSCATPEMAAKEIEMGIAAYNLVRAAICFAAHKSRLPPRDFSFTRAARIVESCAPKISSAGSEQEAQRHFHRMMYFLQQAKLSRRKRKSYPRAVWGIRKEYPNRKN